MAENQDALGHEIYDYHQGKDSYEIIERDDGFITLSPGPEAYFSRFEEWPPHQQKAMDYVQGQVLDIGCGAGRVSLHLQERGFEVVAIDTSPLAVEICRQRGLRDVRLLSITRLSSKLGLFDTLLMMGNNFGLFASPKRAHWLLRRFYHMTSANGMIIAETLDPYATDDPDHLEYHERNRNRNRSPGQLRLRDCYRKFIGPWFDYLIVSSQEMGKSWEERDGKFVM